MEMIEFDLWEAIMNEWSLSSRQTPHQDFLVELRFIKAFFSSIGVTVKKSSMSLPASVRTFEQSTLL